MLFASSVANAIQFLLVYDPLHCEVSADQLIQNQDSSMYLLKSLPSPQCLVLPELILHLPVGIELLRQWANTELMNNFLKLHSCMTCLDVLLPFMTTDDFKCSSVARDLVEFLPSQCQQLLHINFEGVVITLKNKAPP